MKRVKYTYYCDICKEEIKGYPTEYILPDIFRYEGKKEIVDGRNSNLCDFCAKKVIGYIKGITVKKEIPKGDDEY